MLPFISILGREYPTFNLLGLVGFFLATTVAGLRAGRYGLPKSDPIYMGTFAGIGLLVGSSLLFGITQTPAMWAHRAYFTTDFVHFMIRWFGGMVFYGGLFGAIAGIFLYCKVMQQPFATAMKLAIPVVPLAHAIMRVGCFSAGCCHGMEHRLGVTFTNSLGAPNGVPLIPVQLFEAAANLIIFAVLWVFTRKEAAAPLPEGSGSGIHSRCSGGAWGRAPLQKRWGVLAAIYGLMYSFTRFWLEFLRGDAIRGFAFGLSTSQIISILVFFACCVYIYTIKSAPSRSPEA